MFKLRSCHHCNYDHVLPSQKWHHRYLQERCEEYLLNSKSICQRSCYANFNKDSFAHPLNLGSIYICSSRCIFWYFLPLMCKVIPRLKISYLLLFILILQSFHKLETWLFKTRWPLMISRVKWFSFFKNSFLQGDLLQKCFRDLQDNLGI